MKKMNLYNTEMSKKIFLRKNANKNAKNILSIINVNKFITNIISTPPYIFLFI